MLHDPRASAPSSSAQLVADRGLKRDRKHAQLAILASAKSLVSPSSFSSLDHFSRVSAGRGMEVTVIDEKALDRLAHFDALFIRMTTAVGEDAHRFSLRAKKLGLPVIDDPASIVLGSNKVRQHAVFLKHGIPMPRSAILETPDQVWDVVNDFGLPVVLKIAEGCFSRGVEKAETRTHCMDIATRLLGFGGPIIAQEFLPTTFDWRIGILNGASIFACKYHMVSGHWQVVARGSRGSMINGPVEPVHLCKVPGRILKLAVGAANCIGQGLYGVDIKDVTDGPKVIEVNDNPDMDIDAETLANPECWETLANWFINAVLEKNVRASAALTA
jgi:glutathione synthase/RimK-type ligase-like ATP-grasp enzyme